MYFSPASGTKYVGSIFSVAVKVNSGSHTTNAYKAVVTFPTDKLSVTSVSSSNSIGTLWIPPSPTYSNTQGRVTFECGHPGSFAGTGGTIGNITFSVKATGTARLTFTSASAVKAADGAGTEVLGTTGTATFTLQPAPVSAPVVSSSTHPDQSSWYQEKTVELSWTAPPGSDGFSYALNQNAGTIPDDVSEGAGTEKTYPNLADGIHYFHIKAHGTSEWGATTHFRIQIDTTPPDPFEITSEPPAENVTSAPLISAAAVDRPSGIDHYELSLDGSTFETIQLPYQFERIAEGVHDLTIRALDKAGNYRDSSLTLYVVDVPDPQISQPADGSYLPLLESLVVKGTAPIGSVEIYLNGELIAQVGSDGTFEYTHTAFLKPGPYKLTVKAVTEEGIESSPAEVTFKVDARAVRIFGITLPGWLVYSLLLGTVILLILLLIKYLKKVRKSNEHIREDLDRVEKAVEKELDSAEKEIERKVEETLRDGDEARMRQMEHELERKIEEAEGKAKQDLEQLIEKIKKHHGKRKKKE